MIVLVYLFSNSSTSITSSNVPKAQSFLLHSFPLLSPPPKFLQMQLTGDGKYLPPPPLLSPPPKFLQIKQPSKGEASFRVMYYGAAAAGAVPFTWESCPGTPKHHFLFEENSLPPLTPPPSYLPSSTPTRINYKNNKSTKSKILGLDFFRRSKSTSEKPLFSSSSSSAATSKSVPASRNNLYANRWSRSIVHYSFNDDEDEKTSVKASGMSALCFGGGGSRNGAVGGNTGMLRRVRNVKKKILLIVGGSGTL